MSRLVSLLGMLCLLAWSLASAEVYRWVDEHGRVHYDDRPHRDAAEAVTLTPSAPATVTPRPATVPDRQRLLDMYDKQRSERKAAKAEQAKQDRETQKACERLKRTLRYYLSGGPLYIEQDDGGREYLTAADKDQELAQLRSQLASQCGGVPADLQPKKGR